MVMEEKLYRVGFSNRGFMTLYVATEDAVNAMFEGVRQVGGHTAFRLVHQTGTALVLIEPGMIVDYIDYKEESETQVEGSAQIVHFPIGVRHDDNG